MPARSGGPSRSDASQGDARTSRVYSDSVSRPFYYVVDRMNNVRMLIDRAGAIVERYALDMIASTARRPSARTRSVHHVKGMNYDAYGRPRIRESCGRGDMDQGSRMTSTDSTSFTLDTTGDPIAHASRANAVRLSSRQGRAAAKNGSIWDPRADMDAERAREGSVKGDVDSADQAPDDALA